ncbi:MAG: O-antigen ligase family protein [Bacilli bacterium]|nr:O-antigen ligase family protein [Bacilli bacterium]
MKSKNIKLKELLLPIYIILNIIFIFVASYLRTSYRIKNVHIAYSYNIILLINILLIIILFICRKRKNNLKFNIIDLSLLFVLIFSYISCVFAINKHVALYGIGGRYEGLYSICYYFSLMFLTSFIDKKHKKMVVLAIVITGLLQAIYVILQMTKLTRWFEINNFFIIYRKVNRIDIWATGFTTNPNFLGSYLLLGLTYSMGLFFDSKKLIKKIIYIIIFTIFVISLLFSNTLSALVGLFVVYLYVLIYAIKNKFYRKFIIVSFIFIYLLIVMSMLNKTILLKDTIRMGNETKEIATGNLDDNYGTKRMFIWKNTLKVVPNHIIHGVGIDNFYYAFGDEPLKIVSKYFFDKAHNEYLQILICEGIFGLLSYLALFGLIVYRGIKNSYKEKSIYLVLPVIGYLVQAFFNISVIEVAPIFYISLGLLIDRERVTL